MKIYVASPFFCKFDYIIREKAMSHFAKDEMFLPDSTEASKSYSVSPGSEMAKQIFDENINHIKNCDALLFWSPDNVDLGTMMEVGVAAKLGKRIFRYNYLNDSITEVDISKAPTVYPDKFIIRVESIADAYILGYNFDNSNVYYELAEGMHDNIMLSCNFKRVLKNSIGDYTIKTPDFKEVQ